VAPKTLGYSFAFVTIGGLSWQFYLQVRAGKRDIATGVPTLFLRHCPLLCCLLWEEQESEGWWLVVGPAPR